MNNLTGHLGARIRELRKARGLTQEGLAERIEISPRYLSRLEVGQQSASLETLERVAEALQVEIGELFDFGHHDTPKELRQTLRKLMQECDEQELRLAVKIFRAILH